MWLENFLNNTQTARLLVVIVQMRHELLIFWWFFFCSCFTLSKLLFSEKRWRDRLIWCCQKYKREKMLNSTKELYSVCVENYHAIFFWFWNSSHAWQAAASLMLSDIRKNAFVSLIYKRDTNKRFFLISWRSTWRYQQTFISLMLWLFGKLHESSPK